MLGEARRQQWWVKEYHSGKVWLGVEGGLAIIGLSQLPKISGSQKG